jgi:hypothetical protein
MDRVRWWLERVRHELSPAVSRSPSR